MADAIALEFTDPAGDALRIEWRAEAIAGLDPTAPGQTPAWRLGGELDWDEVAELRILTGRLGSTRLIAVAAVRPVDAAGHGDDLVAGASGGPDELERLAQTLVSVEFGADDRPQRVGLELYRTEDAMAVRIAGDVTAVADSVEGAVERSSAALELRAGGDEGVGVLDILRRA